MSKKSKVRKFLVTALAASVLFVGVYAVMPKSAVADTVADLQAQIQALLQQINTLQAQLASLQGGGATTGSSDYCYSFSRNLTVGMKGDDVTALQNILIGEGVWTASNIGATGYFGEVTKVSLAAFQDKHADQILTPVGLSKGTGYFGPSTRSYIASQCVPATPTPTPTPTPSETVTPTPTPTPETTGVTVSVAEDNPAASTLADGSLYNPVLKLTFTAGSKDVTIKGLTVTRGGLVANTSVTGVSAWDESGNRLGNIIEALTADGKAEISFGDDAITVPAGTSKSVTVKVNLSASTDSGTVSFSVASKSDVDTDAEVSGTFPISGNTFGIVDGANSLGDVDVSAQSVAGQSSSSGGANVEVGDLDKEIAKFRFNQDNSKEAIQLEQLTVYVEGTIIESTDVTNWRLYAPDGTLLASADKPVDRYVTFKLATPYVIDKGLSKDLSVKADITDGSQHYFRVHIQNDYDVMVKGMTTGAYLLPLNGSGNTFADTYDSSSGWFIIKQGELTVTKASDSPSGNVSPGSTDVVLAKFNLKAAGEKLEIRKMGVQVKYAAKALTGTVKVKDADTGTTYLSLSADTTGLQTTSAPTASTLSTYQRSLSSYITIPSGETKTIEVLGTVSSNATSSANYAVYVGKFYTKRYSTNDYTTLASGPYYGNTLNVTDVDVTITKSSAFGNVTKTASNEVKIGEYVFQASSADDVKLTSINVTVNGSSSDIQNMKLETEDGTQLGSTVGTPVAGSNSFSVNWTIPASQTKVLRVYADILSSATSGDSLYTSLAASSVSGYGVNSSKSLSSTPSSAVTGQTVTIGTPSLTVKRDASAPTSQVIVAGSTGVTLDEINLESQYEDLTLKKITLSVTSPSSSLWSTTDVASNISKVYLYDGSTLLNTGGTPLSGSDAVISGLNVTLPSDTPKVLTVKADITGSGTMNSTSVMAIKVKSSSTDDMEVYSSQGLMTTGVTLTTSTSDSNVYGASTSYAQSNFFLLHDATVQATNAYSGGTSKTPNATDEIARFTITNPGVRTLTITSFKVYVTLSSASTTGEVTNFRLYDDAGNDIDTNSGSSTSVTGAAPTSTVDFTSANFSAPQEIAAGGSKTYVVKADTSNIRTGLTSGENAYLSVKIDGSKGFDSSEYTGTPTGEWYWNEGDVTYKYTPVDGSEISGLQACDSVPVDGTTLTY